MDLKKLMMMKKKNGVLEKFIFVLSSKRNLIVGFCFGIGVSLFIFTILFFNHSSTSSINPTFLNPMFQGFNGIYMNSSSLSAWYFPFSSSSSSSIDLLQRNGEQRIQQKPSGNELVLKNTHEGKLIDEDKNSSFCVHKGGLSVTEEINGSKGEEEDTSFLVSSEGNCQGKLTKKVKNVTFPNAKEETFHERRQEETRTHVHRNEDFRERMTNKYNRKHKISERTHDHQKFEVSFNDHGDEKRVGNYFGDCDIFDGKWVKLDKKSYYPYGSCPYIDRDFDCQLNGRPDDEFLKWQWQPNDCNIPRLNATDFLERLRGKRLLFVGDSLNRNMWESLVCILRNGVRNKKRVYEISGKTEFKKKGVYSFRYEDYNCSIDFANSPYLVRQSYYYGKNRSMETLRLDLIDQTLSANRDSDVIVYNSGHWWTHDKTSQGEYYYQEGNFVYPKLNPLEAYEKALITWGRWVDKNIDINRTQVVFRGYSPTHFRGGQWNSGGQCHRETEPILNETYLEKYPSKMKVLENILLRMKTPVLYLNISKLTDYRKDAHPSIYRKEYKTIEEKMAAESSQDCSHWCLPGVPDSWNELLYASLLNSAIKSLKN